MGLAVLLAALSGTALADNDPCKSAHANNPYCNGGGSSPTRAPEIDPASAMAGLALALGGLAVLRGRRYSK
jgi:hypothetical protein